MSDIEQHIRRAMEEGKFKHLPGKGKPLQIDDDPLADSDWRLAHHLLKSAGYTLPWIETLKEIDAEVDAARTTLQQAWNWREQALAQKRPYVEVENEWQRALQAFKQQVEKINKRIFDYNLQVPSERFQRLKMNLDKELENIKNISNL